MTTFVFTKNAKKALSRLPKTIQKRIVEKLTHLKTHNDPLGIMKSLYHFEPATHRLRISDYRLILQLSIQEDDIFEFLVLDIGHRKDIYRS